MSVMSCIMHSPPYHDMSHDAESPRSHTPQPEATSLHHFLVITPHRCPFDLLFLFLFPRGDGTEEDASHPFPTIAIAGWEERDSSLSYFLLPGKSRVSLPALSSCSPSMGLSGTSAHLASTRGAAEPQLMQGAPVTWPRPPLQQLPCRQIGYYKNHMWPPEMVAK